MTQNNAATIAVHRNGRVHTVDQCQSAGPAQAHLDLAGWLIAYEMSNAERSPTEPDAAERACQKLLDRLAKLITAQGSQALVSRALHLTRVEFPFLQRIEPGLTGEAFVRGLATSAEGTASGQVRAGLNTLLGTLIGLVALFIGEHLMARLLLEVWPDAPTPEATQPESRY